MNVLKTIKLINVQSNIINNNKSAISICSTLRLYSQYVSAPQPIEMASKIYWNNTVVNNKNAAAPIVILHGLFGSKQNWKSFSKAMLGQTNPPRRVYIH